MTNYRAKDLGGLVKVLREEGSNLLEELDESVPEKLA